MLCSVFPKRELSLTKTTMEYFFTSDEHYGHANILKYCNRPFASVEEMDDTLINNHNSVVGDNDIVIHVGDFTLKGKVPAQNYIRRLKGIHLFVKGSHDSWNKELPYMIEKSMGDIHLVACHYALRVWPRSHRENITSILVYGHSHGHLPPLDNSWDVGVDNNNYFPVSFQQLLKNINYHKKI